MRPDVIPTPLGMVSGSRLPLRIRQLGERALILWQRWRLWERRREVVWYAVIAILLLLYAWLLFTGTISRRH